MAVTQPAPAPAPAPVYVESPPPAPAPVAAPQAPEGSYIDELERLGALRAAGVLTDEEFERQKRQILG